MRCNRTEFIIPNQPGLGNIQARLSDHLRIHSEPPVMIQRSYYDSFDGRLHKNNSLLELNAGGKNRMLIWRSLDSGSILGQTPVSRTPRFLRDLPPGPLHERLAPVLEIRELLPLFRYSTRAQTLRVLNNNGKTITRLVIEDYSVPRQKGIKAGVNLDSRLIVLPVKGYDKACQQVIRLVEQTGLTSSGDNHMLTAISRLGVNPGGQTSKLDLKLDPLMRADRASKFILHRLLEVIITNEAGSRVGTDTEFLHDFRVAIRRTRSALTQIKGVFPLRVVNRYKTEFAWLGEVTSPVRDLDVYLLDFDKYRNSLPASARTHIEPLRDFLHRHHRIEHGALIKALDSARYRRLLESWRKFLEDEVPERTTLPNARRPIHEVAGERIWRVYRSALKEGHAIKPDTPAEALHELRKTCKKLRYLMEFFQSLYPAAKIKALIRILKSLQDNLGNFQDYEVQVTSLRMFSHQMVAEGGVSPDTLLAMGMLIENLERRQHQAREEFASRFAGFATPENRNQFQSLFDTPTA